MARAPSKSKKNTFNKKTFVAGSVKQNGNNFLISVSGKGKVYIYKRNSRAKKRYKPGDLTPASLKPKEKKEIYSSIIADQMSSDLSGNEKGNYKKNIKSTLKDLSMGTLSVLLASGVISGASFALKKAMGSDKKNEDTAVNTAGGSINISDDTEDEKIAEYLEAYDSYEKQLNEFEESFENLSPEQQDVLRPHLERMKGQMTIMRENKTKIMEDVAEKKDPEKIQEELEERGNLMDISDIQSTTGITHTIDDDFEDVEDSNMEETSFK